MSETTSQYVDRIGTFRCVVKEPTSGWFGESPEKLTPFIRIVGEVVEEGDQKGKATIYSAWLSDDAFDRTIKNLVEVFGFNGDLAGLQDGSITFAGAECVIVIESESYEGKPRFKAKWLNPVGGGGGKKMEPDKVKSILSRLGARSKAIAKDHAKATGTTPAATAPKASVSPAVTPTGEPIEDDDIPF